MIDNQFIQSWCLKIHLLGADEVSFQVAVQAIAIVVCIVIWIATEMTSSAS
jgi:hypothetical protein